MKRSHHIVRFAVGMAALAVLVPLAWAGNGSDAPARSSAGMIDDSFRDARPTGVSGLHATNAGIVDDWFRDTQPTPVSDVAATSAGLVDDSFRDAPTLVAMTHGGFHWSDFGIGAGTMLGLLLALVGLTAGTMATRRRVGHVGR